MLQYKLSYYEQEVLAFLFREPREYVYLRFIDSNILNRLLFLGLIRDNKRLYAITLSGRWLMYCSEQIIVTFIV